MKLWIADPATRELATAIPSRERELSYAATHWRPGWRSGITYENGIPVQMWFAQCPDECCASFRRPILPPPETSTR
jgi:hypothetical protein